MEKFKERTSLLLSPQQMETIENARVAVLGLGGVGGAAAEALGRLGIGHIMVADNDTFDPTNLNRQILAVNSTIGMEKTEAAKKRLLDINPNADIVCAKQFYMPDNRDFLFDFAPHAVIDAIDTITAKLDLAEQCAKRGVSLITCLGTGNRLDPSQLRLGDIADTAGGCGCGLARVMRRELKKRGIMNQTVVYSLEMPKTAIAADSREGRHSPGSAPFVPPAAGYLLAYGVLRKLLDI